MRARAASVKGAEQKLRNLQIPQAVLDELRRTGEPVMSIDWPSPADGYIMQKNAIEGQMVRMGEEIFRIAVSTISGSSPRWPSRIWAW